MQPSFAYLALCLTFILFISANGCSSGTGGDLSVENITRVKMGMTLPEVQKIIGSSGRKAGQSDFDQVNAKRKKFGQSKLNSQSGSTMHCWRKGNTWFFVSVDDSTKKITFSTRWSSS